jgi:hypothetical protein
MKYVVDTIIHSSILLKGLGWLPKKSAARKKKVPWEKVNELEREKRDNVPVFDICDELEVRIMSTYAVLTILKEA